MLSHSRNFLGDDSFTPSFWPILPPCKWVSCLELWTAERALPDQQNTPEICKAFWNLPPFTSAVFRFFSLSEILEVSAQMLGLVLNQQILSKAGRKDFSYHNPSFWWDASGVSTLGSGCGCPTSGISLKVWVMLGRPGCAAELAPRLWSNLSAEWALWQAAVPTVSPTQLSLRQAISISNSRTLCPDPRYLALLHY